MSMGAAMIGVGDSLFLRELAAAKADIVGKGQVWVKNQTPNELWFTDDAGTDVQLGTGGGFVDRGDPATPDYTKTDFTIDNAYHDLDLSSIVPAGAKAVLFYINIKDNATGSYMIFRQNGNSDVNNVGILRTQVANIAIDVVMVVACDTDRVIEYLIPTGLLDAINMTIGGWWL